MPADKSLDAWFTKANIGKYDCTDYKVIPCKYSNGTRETHKLFEA